MMRDITNQSFAEIEDEIEIQQNEMRNASFFAHDDSQCVKVNYELNSLMDSNLMNKTTAPHSYYDQRSATVRS